MMRMLLCLTVVLGAPAWAQQEFEIIPLRSQTLDRVLPVLLPLVEAGGTLTGMNDQLFLRASRQNREDIKRALAAIDRPSRRLVIHVTQNRETASASRGAALSGQVVLGNDSRANLQAEIREAQGARGASASQMVQTVEGGQAFIQVGRSLPLPMRQIAAGPGGTQITEAVVYRDVGRGFSASPRLNGERVTIEISQQGDSGGGYGRGGINTQRLGTTVSGRLGEWIELGGVSRQATGSQSGSFGQATTDAREAGAIWLMVEEIR